MYRAAGHRARIGFGRGLRLARCISAGAGGWQLAAGGWGFACLRQLPPVPLAVPGLDCVSAELGGLDGRCQPLPDRRGADRQDGDRQDGQGEVHGARTVGLFLWAERAGFGGLAGLWLGLWTGSARGVVRGPGCAGGLRASFTTCARCDLACNSSSNSTGAAVIRQPYLANSTRVVVINFSTRNGV